MLLPDWKAVIQQRIGKKSLGFGADIKKREEKKLGELLKSLTPEDLLKYGYIPEFIGRLPMLATLTELDEDALVQILKEPKNSLIKQYQKLFELEKVRLRFTDGSLIAIAKEALKRNTGARGLRAITGKFHAGYHVRDSIATERTGSRNQ